MAKRAGYLPLTIPKNRYWTTTITVREDSETGSIVNLTGYTITAQVRETSEESSPLVKAITCTHSGSGGVVTLVMDNSASAVTQDKGYYDLVFQASGQEGETWASGPVAFLSYPTVAP